MTADVIFALIMGLPIVLALFLRVSAPLVFFSLAGGVLIQGVLSDSAILAVSGFFSGQAEQIANLGLLWAPLLLTFVFGRKTYSHGSLGLQLLPLVAAGIAGGAFALPLLTTATQAGIREGFFGGMLRQGEDMVVLVAVLLNLMLMWSMFHRHTGSMRPSKKGK